MQNYIGKPTPQSLTINQPFPLTEPKKKDRKDQKKGNFPVQNRTRSCLFLIVLKRNFFSALALGTLFLD